jgi:hypothetical protein
MEWTLDVTAQWAYSEDQTLKVKWLYLQKDERRTKETY